MRTLNLGILAHVDAGKTTLTEQLLFTTGAIDRVGSVDAGTTQTDSLELERERGITIRSAVAPFRIGDLAVNIVDTPGHPDFIAEVERVLGVLDGAVLVVSAVEGVQPQTPLLFRALQRLKVPTLIFVNKIDRAGADFERTLAAMRRRLSMAVVAPDGPDLTEILAENSEAVLRTFVDVGSLSDGRLSAELRRQTRLGLVFPVFAGSAWKGSGIDELLAGIRQLLVGPAGDPDAPVSGRVFKIERTGAGERVAYVRLFAGTLRARQRIRAGGADEQKPTQVKVFAPAGEPRRDVAGPGEMATLRGLTSVRVGDAIGDPPPGEDVTARFPRPSLEAVVFARRSERQGSLRAALAQLAEQDPLINVQQDELRHEISVSLYGEVQKEVIAATLERDYGIAADFRETTVVCVERPVRVGEAEELIRASTHTNITGRSSPFSTNPFAATLGIRIEPSPPGAGVTFRVDLEPRLVPLKIFKTNEAFLEHMRAFVQEALAEGIAGWEVTDCTVTVVECGYFRTGTTAADFRLLTLLVIAEALERAGTWVCEPLADVSLEMPAPTAPAVLAVVGRLGGRLRGQFTANGVTRAQAVMPVAQVRALQAQLPGVSMGEGILESRPDGYQPIGDNPPARPRTRVSPLEREAWLASLAKRG
jgi:ribosomal protection tetracycline resistance protein